MCPARLRWARIDCHEESVSANWYLSFDAACFLPLCPRRKKENKFFGERRISTGMVIALKISSVGGGERGGSQRIVCLSV